MAEKKQTLPAPHGILESLEELTSKYEGTGLEVEPSDDEGDIRAPFDPKLIDVITQQRTIDLLMARLGHGEMDLSPDFQRRANLWTAKEKSGLIESMLLRIPIPSLYLYEDAEGNYQVVDGLQRICAIAHFVNVAILNKALDKKYNPLRLTDLESLSEHNGKSFPELPRQLQRRITETELTLHVIRAGTPPSVKFNIFSRINKGGLPLRAQEIRNAIYAGRWRDHIRKMAVSTEFLSATENKIKSERLEDHELVLRFVALFSLKKGEYRTENENLDDFLNEFVEKRAATWGEAEWQSVEASFRKALIAAPAVFGRIAFRKYSKPNESRRPINRGLFESETVALAQRSPRDLEILAERSGEVIAAFGEKFETDNEFVSALLYATGRGSSSNTRLAVITDIFDKVLSA